MAEEDACEDGASSGTYIPPLPQDYQQGSPLNNLGYLGPPIHEGYVPM